MSCNLISVEPKALMCCNLITFHTKALISCNLITLNPKTLMSCNLITLEPKALMSCSSQSLTLSRIMSMQDPSSRSNADTSKTEKQRIFNKHILQKIRSLQLHGMSVVTVYTVQIRIRSDLQYILMPQLRTQNPDSDTAFAQMKGRSKRIRHTNLDPNILINTNIVITLYKLYILTSNICLLKL